MKNMKKKFRFRINLKSKHLLTIMTFFCVSAIIATLASGITSAPLKDAAGMIVVPFEKSIASIGNWLGDVRASFQEKETLIAKNEELQNTVDSLTEQNNILIQDQAELSRLEELYSLDEEYSDYPKVAARIISKDPGNWYDTFMINRGSNDGMIISKDPGNWYDTFMINRGSNDGIRVDNNVIAGKGLVGIVTEVGPTWATVRAIIDDSSNVSAMTVSTDDTCVIEGDLELIDEGKLRFSQLYDREDTVRAIIDDSSNVSAMTVSTDDTCVIEGDLELIDEGKLRFSQLYDREDKVSVGERIVTSNISEKYVEGLFIGYVSEIQLDTNNLTKIGTIVTPVDFQHLKDVFVITVNKQDSIQGKGQTEASEPAEAGQEETGS